jgi:hypothetical protein
MNEEWEADRVRVREQYGLREADTIADELVENLLISIMRYVEKVDGGVRN